MNKANVDFLLRKLASAVKEARVANTLGQFDTRRIESLVLALQQETKQVSHDLRRIQSSKQREIGNDHG